MLTQASRRIRPHILRIVAFCVIFLVTLWLLRRAFDQPIAEPLAPVPVEDDLKDIHNRTLGFEKIFVVNRPARTDRRDAMTLAAAFTDLNLSWISAVSGDQVLDLTIPLDKEPANPPRSGDKGGWRSHLHAIHAVVEQRLTTALIMEDDLDWDIRLRDQLRTFALSTRALLQPLSILLADRADPTFPQHDDTREIVNISFSDLPETARPRTSLYGDHWDVLWLGHCRMEYPSVFDEAYSLGRVVQSNDPTVPSRNYMHGEWESAKFTDDYPDHTRVTHHAKLPLCSHAYAITQRAARVILFELSIERYTDPFDVSLAQLCEGQRGPERKLTCITTQPALFKHWKPRGWVNSASDIANLRDEWKDVAGSEIIRWSVGVNMERLVRGETGDWIDQYPDTGDEEEEEEDKVQVTEPDSNQAEKGYFITRRN
ncbi:hypothetical protein BDV96DRAFT_672175 [Lophiotrema nucula]|uniref:Glycosyltransferase family 25 protein n=1 Tax=Lophiotrema nucula TaxID=690887 RepID=A0A6A5ZP79_9PLEO|nr:hypothetical protein BDV96DRAFT_672175 [Lophiotrema nucula]